MTMPAAAWYPAPNEPGLMRWWDGARWTEHRQPLPPVEPPAPTDAPLSAPQQPFAPENLPRTVSDAVEGFVHGAAADDRVKANAATAAGGALIADGVVGFGRNRQGIGGGLAAIVFGILWLMFASTLMGLFGSASPTGGEVAGTGTVSDVVWSASSPSRTTTSRSQPGQSTVTNDSGPSCAAVLTVTVNGKDYQKREGVYQSPCTAEVGQTRKVFYEPSNIAGTLRVAPTDQLATMQKVFPLFGLLPLIGGIWTVIKRGGSIVGGILLLRNGLRRRKQLAEEDN